MRKSQPSAKQMPEKLYGSLNCDMFFYVHAKKIMSLDLRARPQGNLVIASAVKQAAFTLPGIAAASLPWRLPEIDKAAVTTQVAASSTLWSPRNDMRL